MNPFKTGHVYRFIHVSGYFSRGAALNRDIYDHRFRGKTPQGKTYETNDPPTDHS